jgi:hypothetical protein
VLGCPVNSVCLGEDVESDSGSKVVSGTGFVRDWVAVIAVLCTPFQPDVAIDGMSAVVNIMAVDGAPLEVLVHCAPVAVRDIATGGCSHVLG